MVRGRWFLAGRGMFLALCSLAVCVAGIPAFAATAPPTAGLSTGVDPKGTSISTLEVKPAAAAPFGPGSVKALFGQGFVAEVEPNGTSATATPIPGASNVVQGNVFPNADVDFFSFTGAAGDRVYAAVMTSFTASASVDSFLDLIAPDGTTVIEGDNDDGSLGSTSSTIAGRTLSASGTHFLRVRHNLATAQIRPYRLYLQVRTGAPTPETESNDTFPGQAMPAGGWVSGSTSATTDLDFFAISLAAGDTVFISLDLDPERDAVEWNAQTGLGAFGTPPLILVVNDAGTATPDSEAYFMTVKAAGTYGVFVGVPTGGATIGTYHLSVTVFPNVDVGVGCTTYTSTDVPVAIPTGPGIVSSTLTVPGNPRIADLDVVLNLTHNFMADLDLELTAPAGVGGNTVGLVSDVGSVTVGAQTTMDLTLDDEAGIPPSFTVVQGLNHTPELAYRLGWFDGQPAGGTWTLTLRDDATGDGGTLTGWSIRICEPPPPPACAPGFAQTTVFSTDFESGAAGFTHSGAQDEWELGNPTFAPVTGCNSGTSCWKTDLDNTYNASSNQDLLSPNVNLAGLSAPVIVNWAQKYQMESATFDHLLIDAREVANPANAVRLYEFLDATMTNTVGNPGVTVQEAAGWGQFSARIDSLAGLNSELRFHLDSDTTVQMAGLAVDDVSVTACRLLQADLAITKTDGVATAVPGGSVTYSITASNAGPDPVTGATVADTFPAILTCTWTCAGAGGGTCTAAGSGNINDTVNLPAGGSVTYTASCTINASATGTLVNTATVSSTVADPDPANNSATDTDTLTPQADLAITKTDGVATAVPGGSVTYTITASNAGPSNAPGSTVADTFPASLTCTWTCAGAGGGTCTAAGSGNINDTVNLPAGGSVTYTASCTINASASGTLSNTATVAAGAGVTDPTPGNNSATDTDTLTPQADLSITKTDGVTSATPGGSTTYTIVASSSGPSNAPSSSVSDTAPAACTSFNWTCVGAGGGTCTAAGSGSIGDNVNLPAGAAVTYTAVCNISGAATGTLVNTATVSTTPILPPSPGLGGGGVTDPNPGNNSATDTDTLGAQADLSITKTDGLTNATAGQAITYTIVASNAGPSGVTGATVADTFPAALTGVTWTCVGAGGGTCTAAGAGSINDLVNLPDSATVTYTVNATISPSFTGTLSNTATVTAPGGVTDPNPANDSATDTTTVAGQAAVTGTKEVAGDFSPGGAITYTVTLTNNGGSPQGDNPGDELTDVLPPEVTLVSASATSGTAVANTGTNTVTWNGSIPAGGSVTITIDATIDPNASGDISNQGTIAFDADNNGTNESIGQTDDPAAGGPADPTVFGIVVGTIAIPTLDGLGLMLLVLALAGAAFALLRRRAGGAA